MEVKNRFSDTVTGVAVLLVVLALAIPLLLSATFICWGWAGRAFHFMMGGF